MDHFGALKRKQVEPSGAKWIQAEHLVEYFSALMRSTEVETRVETETETRKQILKTQSASL